MRCDCRAASSAPTQQRSYTAALLHSSAPTQQRSYQYERSPDRDSGFEKAHFHARQLHDIIVAESVRLGTDGLAIDEREVTLFTGLNMNDVVAFSAACDSSNLNARATQGR